MREDGIEKKEWKRIRIVKHVKLQTRNQEKGRYGKREAIDG